MEQIGISPTALREVLEAFFCPTCRQPLDPDTFCKHTEADDTEGELPLWWSVRCHGCGWEGPPNEAAAGHTMGCGDWAVFLETAFPSEYREPPPTQFPTICRPGSNTGKVEVLYERRRRKQHLWHPRDAATKLVVEEVDQLASVGHRGPNGAVHADTDVQSAFCDHWRGNAIAIAIADNGDVPPLPPSIRARLSGAQCPRCGYTHRHQAGGRLRCWWCQTPSKEAA